MFAPSNPVSNVPLASQPDSPQVATAGTSDESQRIKALMEKIDSLHEEVEVLRLVYARGAVQQVPGASMPAHRGSVDLPGMSLLELQQMQMRLADQQGTPREKMRLNVYLGTAYFLETVRVETAQRKKIGHFIQLSACLDILAGLELKELVSEAEELLVCFLNAMRGLDNSMPVAIRRYDLGVVRKNFEQIIERSDLVDALPLPMRVFIKFYVGKVHDKQTPSDWMFKEDNIKAYRSYLDIFQNKEALEAMESFSLTVVEDFYYRLGSLARTYVKYFDKHRNADVILPPEKAERYCNAYKGLDDELALRCFQKLENTAKLLIGPDKADYQDILGVLAGYYFNGIERLTKRELDYEMHIHPDWKKAEECLVILKRRGSEATWKKNERLKLYFGLILYNKLILEKPQEVCSSELKNIGEYLGVTYERSWNAVYLRYREDWAEKGSWYHATEFDRLREPTQALMLLFLAEIYYSHNLYVNMCQFLKRLEKDYKEYYGVFKELRGNVLDAMHTFDDEAKRRVQKIEEEQRRQAGREAEAARQRRIDFWGGEAGYSKVLNDPGYPSWVVKSRGGY